jgi:serine protease Do
MKQVFMKRLLIAAIAVLTVPATLLAQKEKEEKDQKDKEKKEMKQIIITRTGNTDEKMVIEVDGDKVKINGKDAKDVKDANVNVNTIKGTTFYRMNNFNNNGFTMNWDNNDHMSLFSEDENRAMLGVVTEGNDKGAEIQSVTKESAAEKAGLKKGDIITRIGDKKVESTDDVTEAIHAQKPGDKVNVTYLRDGKEQKATAELGKWKGIKMNAVTVPGVMGRWNMDTPEPPMPYGANIVFGRPRLGLSIQDTDDGVGVKVLDVDQESNAAKAGLKKDDVIVGIDDHEIKGTDDVTRIIRTTKDKTSFNFKIKRDGKNQNIEVKFPKKLKTADL